MHHLPFLAQVHDLLQPRTYVEIGGRDDFAGIDPPAAEGEPSVDLALISRPKRFRHALQGVIDVEKHAGPGSVLIMDDVLPRPDRARASTALDDEADIWKIVPTLRAVRPDLLLILVRTVPTGMLLILGADPDNRQLETARDELLARHEHSGEPVPAEIVTRASAVYPAWLMGAPFWDVLGRHRNLTMAPAQGRAELLAAMQVWAGDILNDRQARAIHPTLSGRRSFAAKAGSTTSPNGSGLERGIRTLGLSLRRAPRERP